MGNAFCDFMDCEDCRAIAKLNEQEDDTCPSNEYNRLSREEKRNLMIDFVTRLKERTINEHPTLDITMDDLADIFVQEMSE